MNHFKDNITDPDFWLRLLYTLLFALAWQVVELLLAVILVVQILFRLFTGRPHDQVAGLGNSLSQYAWQMGRYVSAASDEKPWPFSDWPAADAQWQPRPPQGPVTVDPHDLTSAPVASAQSASVPEATQPEPPVVEPDAPVLHPTDDGLQAEPPIVQPLLDETGPADADEGQKP